MMRKFLPVMSVLRVLSPNRPSSNGKVPLQMSEKLGKMGPKENTPHIKELFEKILCRLPTDEELQECLLFLDKMPKRSLPCSRSAKS